MKLLYLCLCFDPELLSHKDIGDEFTSQLGLSQVKQLIVTRLFGKYYKIDGDYDIRTILNLLCELVINFFVVKEGEQTFFAQYRTHHIKIYFIDVEVGTYCEHSLDSGGEWIVCECK